MGMSEKKKMTKVMKIAVKIFEVINHLR